MSAESNSSSMPIDAQLPGSSDKPLALPISKAPAFYASKTDEFIIRLAKLLKTTAGLSSTLSFSSYTLYIAAYLYAISPNRAQVLARLSQILGRPVSKLPEALEKIPPAPAGASPFQPVIGIINDTRFAIRLTGLVPMYVLLRSLVKNKNPKDKTLHRFALVQACAYVFFQVCENVWLLTNRGIVAPQWVAKRGGAPTLLKWSCRAWFVALSCDVARLAREALIAKEQNLSEKLSQEDLEAAEQKWYAELFTVAAWLPMAVHYSVDGGIGMNLGMVGLSGMLGGFGGLSKAWAATKD